MSGFLWKPFSDNDGKLAVLNPPEFTGKVSGVKLLGPNGQELAAGRFTGVGNGNRGTYRFDKPGAAFPAGTQVRFEFDGGGGATYAVNSTGSRVEGGTPSYFGGGQRVAQAPATQYEEYTGAQGGGSSGVSALPFYYGAAFPKLTPVQFPGASIETFKFTDPNKYAQEIGAQNIGNLKSSFDLSGDFALQAIRNELASLKEFAPAAAALSRELTSVDNQFNLAQRRSAVTQALPGVEGDLRKQTERANTYAEGKLPTAAMDAGFELGVRGRAGDTATFAGFGPGGAARNLSDIMSAESRFQIGQYGEQLLGQNIKTKADLFLPPTAYANTGQQVKVTPEVGAGRLTYSGFGAVNEATMLNPAQALTAKMGQEQFIAQGMYDASKFNSVGAFEVALGKFNYDVGYLSQLQAANQANLNAAWNVNMQGIRNTNAAAGLDDAQAASTIADIGSAIGAISGAWDSVADIASSTSSAPVADSQISSSTTTDDFQLESPSVGVDRIGRSGGGSYSGVDASAPTAIKYSGANPPTGYTALAGSPGVAVASQSYTTDLERFARYGTMQAGSVSVANAAQADRTLANAAKLSYIPVGGFQPLATLSNGQQVYSLPAAAGSGNVLAGAEATQSLNATLAALGVSDMVSSAPTNVNVDNLERVFSVDGKAGQTDAGQQTKFMAARLKELWPSLSPEQKSMGISALNTMMWQAHNGFVGDKAVPNTSGSPADELKVKDVVRLTSKGVNGFSLARNYKQLAGLAAATVKGKSVDDVAFVARQTGMLGYGPQGSAVKVTAKDLRAVGAQPAPEFGVGAAVFKTASSVPQQYAVLTKTPDNQVVAIPKNLQHTTTLGTGSPGPLAFEKAVAVSQRKHPAQKLWKAGNNKVVRGSVGGSAVVAGINVMSKANSSAMGSMVAYSLFGNTFGEED